MKKLFIITAVLLVAALFITCDTGGDWSNPAFAAPEGTKILGEGDFSAAQEDPVAVTGNLIITFTPALDATGYSKMTVVFNGYDDGWWVGAQVDSHDDSISSATTKSTGWMQGKDLDFKVEKGFGLMTIPVSGTLKHIGCTDESDPSVATECAADHQALDPTNILKWSVSGGGGTKNPGFTKAEIFQIWLLK